MTTAEHKMPTGEANCSFENAQDGQDALVLGMSTLKLCPGSNKSIQKTTATLNPAQKDGTVNNESSAGRHASYQGLSRGHRVGMVPTTSSLD